MAVPSLALTAVGGIVGAFGAASAGESQAAMYRYQAGVAQVNRQIAEQNAEYATAAGETRAQMSGMGTRATIGQIRATQGASNLDVNRGSAVDVRAGAAEVGAQDQAMIRANAAREAYGYKTQATGFEAESRGAQFAARNTETATGYNVASSLLGAGTSVADKWYRMNAAGVGSSAPRIWS